MADAAPGVALPALALPAPETTRVERAPRQPAGTTRYAIALLLVGAGFLAGRLTAPSSAPPPRATVAPAPETPRAPTAGATPSEAPAAVAPPVPAAVQAQTAAPTPPAAPDPGSASPVESPSAPRPARRIPGFAVRPAAAPADQPEPPAPTTQPSPGVNPFVEAVQQDIQEQRALHKQR